METNKQLETMEEQLKLMKGELKQSLASVRDYLLNMELPSSEFATVLAALGNSGDQNMTMKGSFTAPPDNALGKSSAADSEETSSEELQEESLEPESELTPEEEDLTGPDESYETMEESSPGGALDEYGENLGPDGELLSEEEAVEPDEAEEFNELEEPAVQAESFMPEPELHTEEERQMEYEMINAELRQSTPEVNLLSNLVNWVARAKKEIGYEQLPIFLEVYGISGHLSAELKEVIIHLADITSEKPEDVSTAEIWSQSMQSLHGILTGGDAPLHPVKPFWNNDDSEVSPDDGETTGAEIETEVVKTKEMPVKLKLVLPDGDGESKEFCLDFNPSPDNNGS